MKQRTIMALVVAGALLLTTGCKTLFPSNSSTVESQWKSYAEVQSAFEKIIPDQTDTNNLRQLGFDPSITPNVKVLTYVDVIQIFMPNPGIRLKDLPEGVGKCIEGREESCAYQIDLQTDNSHRYGNLLLDILGFKRKTHDTGWSFKGLILIRKGLVVYKLSSGEPQISRNETVRHPLGPLQQLDGQVLSIVKIPN